MKQLLTKGIILSRTDFGEADRIITVLTPEAGKLRLLAKGVRKIKSKLAGGIELFSVSDLTYLQGKGEVGTLVSSRLDKHYGRIVSHIERVQLGYELIKELHKATEDHPEAEYFHLLDQTFVALDDSTIPLELVRLWFDAQLLRLAGHEPNLRSDKQDATLDASRRYTFDFESMCFAAQPEGRFSADHIKLLRLLFSNHTPGKLTQVQGIAGLLADITPLIRTMLTSFVRV